MSGLIDMFFSKKKLVTVLESQFTGEKWIQERAKGGATTLELWVVGYLSGLAVGSNEDFLKGASAASILEVMDRRCALKPLLRLSEIAGEVADELRK